MVPISSNRVSGGTCYWVLLSVQVHVKVSSFHRTILCQLVRCTIWAGKGHVLKWVSPWWESAHFLASEGSREIFYVAKYSQWAKCTFIFELWSNICRKCLLNGHGRDEKPVSDTWTEILKNFKLLAGTNLNILNPENRANFSYRACSNTLTIFSCQSMKIGFHFNEHLSVKFR